MHFELSRLFQNGPGETPLILCWLWYHIDALLKNSVFQPLVVMPFCKYSLPTTLLFAVVFLHNA